MRTFVTEGGAGYIGPFLFRRGGSTIKPDRKMFYAVMNPENRKFSHREPRIAKKAKTSEIKYLAAFLISIQYDFFTVSDRK